MSCLCHGQLLLPIWRDAPNIGSVAMARHSRVSGRQAHRFASRCLTASHAQGGRSDRHGNGAFHVLQKPTTSAARRAMPVASYRSAGQGQVWRVAPLWTGPARQHIIVTFLGRVGITFSRTMTSGRSEHESGTCADARDASSTRNTLRASRPSFGSPQRDLTLRRYDLAEPP
jgi:hypothetical protein